MILQRIFMHRSNVQILFVLGALVGCGGPMSTTYPDGAVIRPELCTSVCACAERGPPNFTGATRGTASATADMNQQQALARANYWRTAAGLEPLSSNTELEQAATAHAQFMATNPQSCWPGAHSQNNTAGCRGFTGRSPGDRLSAAGYQNMGWSEVIDWADTPDAAIDEWIWTVYHRAPFMSWEFTQMGYGVARGPFGGRTANHNVVDFGIPRGMAGTRPPEMALFPPAGAQGVRAYFRGDLEGPTPPGPGLVRPWPQGVSSGTVVSMHFGSDTFIIQSHEFYRSNPRAMRPECDAVVHTFISRENDTNLMNARHVFLYANEQLQPRTEYVARIKGTHDGRPFDRSWAFTTE